VARKRILKRGMIELRKSALPCKIIDLSNTGAGLALSGASHVPNFFTLLIPGRTPAFCQVIWRRRETGRDFSRVAGSPGLLRLMICAANNYLEALG
jgi:hypothetical protein